jgi:hypothetical protein
MGKFIAWDGGFVIKNAPETAREVGGPVLRPANYFVHL